MRAAPVARAAAVAAAASVALAAAGAVHAAAAPVPVLAPWSPPSVERDLPQVVQERNTRVQQALFSQARAAARLQATAAAGCVRSSGGSLGSPAPQISSRVLGHHVEVSFEFRELPTSPACRPFLLTAVVYSGRKASATFKNSVGRFRVRGSTGRVAVMLPFLGQPPYHVTVASETITGRRGPEVERALPCPAAAGCLRGYEPAAHAWTMPTPVLPTRGLDRRSLAASFAQVLADEGRPPIVAAVPRGSRCLSLRVCEATYADPAFPRSPFRVRYAIAGQQLSGCWLGLQGRTIDPLPYDDARSARIFLAGCASWLR